MITRRALAAAALLPAVARAQAPERAPPQLPFLRIEAGAHTAPIGRVAVDPAGTLLATASEDKTIRLWSLPDGAPAGVLRVPIGAREAGQLYAVAFSGDGRRLFASGDTAAPWDGGFAIYLFDVARGVLLNAISRLPAPVFHLAVSADGRLLAAGLGRGGGVRIWEVATGRQVFADAATPAPVRCVVFDHSGVLVASSDDGRVRVYDTAGSRIAEAFPQTGGRPYGLAVSPDGALLAVGYENRLRVDVLALRTLRPVFAPDVSGLTGDNLSAVTWAADGRGGVQLMASGIARAGGDLIVRRWGDYGLGVPRDLPVATDVVNHLVPLPGGGAVFAANDPGWGRIAPDGSVARRAEAPGADLRDAHARRLAIAPDGRLAEFAVRGALLRFDAAGLTTVATADPSLAAPVQALPGLALGMGNARATARPTLNGQPLTLEAGEFARCGALLPDGSGVLLGTDYFLRRFRRDGAPLAAIAVPAAVLGVTIAPDGRTALAALADGTLRWFGLDKGEPEERAALFVHADTRRWVLWTPEGFFDHAALGGRELVGIHLNRGRLDPPEFVSFAQAYRALYAPSLVRARLAGDAGLVRARLAEVGDLRALLARQPTARVAGVCVPDAGGGCQVLRLAPRGDSRLPPGVSLVRLDVRLADRGLGIGAVDAFLNERNAGRSFPSGTEHTIEVPLDPGRNTVTLRVYDAAGAVFTETEPLALTTDEPAVERGRLHVLAIGVDRYRAPALDLRFAVADARAFVDTVRAVTSPLYRDMEATLLTDAQATRSAILDALDRLARVVRPGDTFLFYVASHGLLNPADNRFLMVPHDVADTSSVAAIARQSIDDATLLPRLARIPARNAMLFLDTCHSGQLTADTLANLGHETGRFILTASTSVQEALDSYDNRNGLFLFALREGLTGRAPQDQDGVIGALSLGEFVSRRVSQLARERQHSQDAVFRTALRELRSFPVALIAR